MDLDTPEHPESPAVMWTRWLQAESDACRGICSIPQIPVATPPGEVVGRALSPCLRCLSFTPRTSHPAGNSGVEVLAFEGGHEAAVPILAGRDLDGLTEISWGCEIFGLAVSLPPSLLLKPFQLPGSRDAGGEMPPVGEQFVSQPVGSGPQVLLHRGVEEMVCWGY